MFKLKQKTQCLKIIVSNKKLVLYKFCWLTKLPNSIKYTKHLIDTVSFFWLINKKLLKLNPFFSCICTDKTTVDNIFGF